MDKPHFPIRAQLIAGESFKGYVLRVTAAMHYQSIKELHSMLNQNYAKGNFEITSERYRNFAKLISDYTLHDFQHFVTHFDYDVRFDVDETRHLKDIRFNTPKICIECVKEGSLAIRQSWLYHHHTYCEDHGVELLEGCPVCGETFDWLTHVILGCPACGVCWNELDMPKSEIPVYQSVMSEFSGVNKKTFLGALYEAVAIVLEPLSPDEKFYYKMPSKKLSSHELFSLAYDLLTNGEVREQFIVLLEQHWEQHVSHLSSEMINVLSQKIQRLSIFCDLAQSSKVVSERVIMSKVFHCNEIESLVSIDKMAEIIGLSSHDVISLNVHNHIDSVTSGKSTLINLNQIDRLVDRLKMRAIMLETKGNCISLLSLSSITSAYCCPYANIIDFALNDNFLFYKERKTLVYTLADFYLPKEQVYDYLNEYLPTSLRFPVSMTQLKAVTKLTCVQTGKLIDILQLKKVPISAKRVSFDAEPLVNFLEKKILLNRWAKLNKIDLRKLKAFLENYGIMPDESSLPRHQIWIYPKTDEVDKRLKYYLYHLHKYKGASPFFLYAKSFQKFSETITIFY